MGKHNRSLKVLVQGLDFMAHPLYIHIYKICDNRTWKKHLFLDISSTNIDTLVPSLYQCVETCNIEVF
jgi:hypothetical protein